MNTLLFCHIPPFKEVTSIIHDVGPDIGRRLMSKFKDRGKLHSLPFQGRLPLPFYWHCTRQHSGSKLCENLLQKPSDLQPGLECKFSLPTMYEFTLDYFRLPSLLKSFLPGSFALDPDTEDLDLLYAIRPI